MAYILFHLELGQIPSPQQSSWLPAKVSEIKFRNENEYHATAIFLGMVFVLLTLDDFLLSCVRS